MTTIPTPQIDPRHVGNPVQLLAALLSAMAVLVVSFLTAAGFIQEPRWALAGLIVAAIANIPLFIALLFLMLTRFRHVLLADEHYLRWLDRSRRRFRGFAPRALSGDTQHGDEDLVDLEDLAALERARVARYQQNQGLFLTYDSRPSVASEESEDIVVRLQQHVSNQGESGPLARGEVESVDYYLGPQFLSGKAMRRQNPDDGFRLDVTAYSPVLCVAAVRLTTGDQPILLEQYLAFTV